MARLFLSVLLLLCSRQDLWQIFRDSCESKEHILMIDPRTWALFLGDLGEGAIVL